MSPGSGDPRVDEEIRRDFAEMAQVDRAREPQPEVDPWTGKIVRAKSKANIAEERARKTAAMMEARRSKDDTFHSRAMQAVERREKGKIPHLGDITSGEWALGGIAAGAFAWWWFF